MLTALSGTPGTGKSTVASIMEERGVRIVEVSAFASEMGCIEGMDSERGSLEVDTDCLGNLYLDGYRTPTLFEGHLAHFLPVETVILLRTSPAVLETRLASRGWPLQKVRENMEAEACDVILIEATEMGKTVYEIDTTSKSPQSVADDIERILSGDVEDFLPGRTDWSEEVLSWY